MSTRHREEHVCNEIAHQDEIDETAEHQPGIVFNGSSVEVVVSRDLCLEFAFDKGSQFRMRILTVRGAGKYLSSACPSDKHFMVRLHMQKVADTNVVARSPE